MIKEKKYFSLPEISMNQGFFHLLLKIQDMNLIYISDQQQSDKSDDLISMNDLT